MKRGVRGTWLAVLLPMALGAQEVVDTAAAVDSVPAVDRPAVSADTATWVAVSSRPRSTVVSVTLTYPAGARQDAEGKGGTAWLLARTMQTMAAAALGPTFRVTAETSRNRFSVNLLAEPDRWEDGLRTLHTVLSRRDVSEEVFQDARARLLNRMTFEAGAPVREFEAEAARLYGAGEIDWARRPSGSPESLAALTVRDLERFRSQHVGRGMAVAAVVGPVIPSAAVASVAEVLGSGPAGSPGSAPGRAWETGDRLPATRDITNTALAFAYPLPVDHPRTDAEFLAHVLREKLVSDPPDPGVYGVETRLVEAPSGPLLVIEAAVFPEVGSRWEQKILSAVRDTQFMNPDEDVFFPWQHRRFRSAALHGDAAPEDLGRRMTEDLLRSGRVRDLEVETRGLSARSLVTLANGLGEPRILVFGPDLTDRQ